MFLGFGSIGRGFCPPDKHGHIGDLDTEPRKTQLYCSCRGAIYPPQEHTKPPDTLDTATKALRHTSRRNQSPQTHMRQQKQSSDSFDATATTHMLDIKISRSFVYPLT
ncbi:hypothetical protein TNCV_2192871 [Trichonephila clavipes]|nr:hypothetical protein TNCV_2192871 [Trichonephila clavipes]